MLIKYPAVAGMFYTNDKVELEEQVKHFINSSVETKSEGNLKTIISPHAGYKYSGIVAGSVYKKLKELDANKKYKIIMLGPSHRYPLKGGSVCAYDKIVTPLGDLEVSPLAKQMAKDIGFNPKADQFEHSLEVQFPFLQIALPNSEIIPIVLGSVDITSVANYLKSYIDENTILIISTDLSHFFEYEKALQVDNICNIAIPSLDVDTMINKGDACGIIGVTASMMIAKENNWKGQFVDYKNSGDTAGDKSSVVGYGAYAFYS